MVTFYENVACGTNATYRTGNGTHRIARCRYVAGPDRLKNILENLVVFLSNAENICTKK